MRNIYTIKAIQIITSEQNPQGIKSNVPNFPVDVDSRTYATEANPNGNTDTAIIVAQSKFAQAVEAMTVANNANRVMWAVTLEQANGVQIARKSYGAFPDMTPQPEPEPEPEEQGEQE